MKTISREKFFELKSSESSHHKSFSHSSGVQNQKQDGSRTFSVAFEESIKPIYSSMTGNRLRFSQQYGNFWHFIENDEEYEQILDWEGEQGTRVFLRDLLTVSLAMDFNFSEMGQKTEIGLLEEEAKHNRDGAAISELATLYSNTIGTLPYYLEADAICAVPQKPQKKFSLPVEIVKIVAANTRKDDVTHQFVCGGTWESIKDERLEAKWKLLEKAQLSFNGNLGEKKVILLDDKYQSGVTMQFIAQKLQEAGAKEVYGLCAVKTWRDTDNC